MTSNLLTAFMLGGWIAMSPAAFAAGGSYSIHGGVIQGSGHVGELRMAGTVPVANMAKHYVPPGVKWNSRTRYQTRHSGGKSYANLNQ